MSHPLELCSLKGATAVLGGSFDPIHLGHLHLGGQILSRSPIEKVLFVPCGRHNFKKDSLHLDFNHRFNLVKEAIKGYPRFALGEEDRQGSGYSADLMKKLYRQNPATSFVFVLGSDNLPSLPRWHNYAWLKSSVPFLVLPRPGYPVAEEVLVALNAVVLDIEPSPVSATEIRERIWRGETIRGLVPQALESKITELYRRG